MEEKLLKNFLQEFFDFDELKNIGLFEGIKKTDYQAQADRLCKYFCLKTIYEYRAETISAHISYAEDKRPKDEPFITILPGIYE